MFSSKVFNKKLVIVIGTVFLVALLATMTACAPQQDSATSPQDTAAKPTAESNDESEGSAPETISLNFTMESDCASCHKTPMESEQNTLTVASIHAAQGDISCITCHNQEQELTQAHANAKSMDEPKNLKTAKISEETCIECHGSYEDLSEYTKNVTVLTDVDGLTINPHSAKQLNAEHESEITCMKCHTEHKEIDEKKSQNYCMNCHHAQVYECYTCHE